MDAPPGYAFAEEDETQQKPTAVVVREEGPSLVRVAVYGALGIGGIIAVTDLIMAIRGGRNGNASDE